MIAGISLLPRASIPRSMHYLLLAAVLVVENLNVQKAAAGDWRFCLARSEPEGKTYVTSPFPTNSSLETIQEKFGDALSRAALRHAEVQCPRGDQRLISTMRAKAIEFNREIGSLIVEFNWTP